MSSDNRCALHCAFSCALSSTSTCSITHVSTYSNASAEAHTSAHPSSGMHRACRCVLGSRVERPTYKSVGDAALVTAGCGTPKGFHPADLIDAFGCKGATQVSEALGRARFAEDASVGDSACHVHSLLSTMMNGGKSCVATLQHTAPQKETERQMICDKGPRPAAVRSVHTAHSHFFFCACRAHALRGQLVARELVPRASARRIT